MTLSRSLWCCLLIFSLNCLPLLADQEDSQRASKVQINSPMRTKSVAILREALKSDSFWPSMHAAEALTLSGYGDEVLTALKGRLELVQDQRQRCGLAREQVRAGDRSKLAELEAVMANPDPYAHEHACESLYKIREVGDVKLMRASMNDSSDPSKALLAAAALGRTGDETGLEFIRAEIQKQDSQNSWLAAWLLGTLGDQRDIQALKYELSRAESPRNRAYFEHTLGLLGDAAGQKALIGNLQSSDASIRADAAYMVGDAGLIEAMPQLTALLDDKQLDVAVRAAQGLLTLERKRFDATKDIRAVKAVEP